jgi:uncharacterized protein
MVFFKADCCNQTNTWGALLVFYSSDIGATLNKVIRSGGELVRPIFEFPGMTKDLKKVFFK